jgi:hypothetical protein
MSTHEPFDGHRSVFNRCGIAISHLEELKTDPRISAQQRDVLCALAVIVTETLSSVMIEHLPNEPAAMIVMSERLVGRHEPVTKVPFLGKVS